MIFRLSTCERKCPAALLCCQWPTKCVSQFLPYLWSIIFRFSRTVVSVCCSLFLLMTPSLTVSFTLHVPMCWQFTHTMHIYILNFRMHCIQTHTHTDCTAACAVMWQLHSNCNICCCCCTASAVPAVAGSWTTMDSKSSSCNCNWQCNLTVGQQHVPQAMQFLCSQLPKRRTTYTHSRMPDNWPGYPWSCNNPVAIDAGDGNWNWLRPQGYIRLMMV